MPASEEANPSHLSKLDIDQTKNDDAVISIFCGNYFDTDTIEQEMNRRATQQCNMSPYVYAVYWLPPASSAFLLVRKCN